MKDLLFHFWLINIDTGSLKDSFKARYFSNGFKANLLSFTNFKPICYFDLMMNYSSSTMDLYFTFFYAIKEAIITFNMNFL